MILCKHLLESAFYFSRYEEDGRRICDAFVIGVAGTQTANYIVTCPRALNISRPSRRFIEWQGQMPFQP